MALISFFWHCVITHKIAKISITRRDRAKIAKISPWETALQYPEGTRLFSTSYFIFKFSFSKCGLSHRHNCRRYSASFAMHNFLIRANVGEDGSAEIVGSASVGYARGIYLPAVVVGSTVGQKWL